MVRVSIRRPGTVLIKGRRGRRVALTNIEHLNTDDLDRAREFARQGTQQDDVVYVRVEISPEEIYQWTPARKWRRL